MILLEQNILFKNKIMGKTFKRNSQFRPKKNGRVFSKDDKAWKKPKHKPLDNDENLPPIEDYRLPDTDI